MNARKLISIALTLSLGLTWSGAKADDFVPADTNTGNVTATAGLSSTGATVDLNASSNFTTNINTGTSTGAVSIGNSLAGAVGITSGAAFTLTAGAASTLSTTTGNLNLQAAGTGTGNVQVGTGGAGTTTPDYLALDVKSTTGDPAGGTEGYMYYNTFDNKFRCFENAAWKDCDTTGGATSLQTAYGNGATITTAGAVPVAFTLTSGGFNVTGAGATAIGNNTGTVAIDSTSWDISSAGAASGLTGLASSGTVSFTGGMSASGAAINLNDSSSFAVNIATGTSTGAVNIATGNSAGNVSMGTGTGTQTLSVGTGAGAKTVGLGSNNTTSTTNILSGSGAVNVNAGNNQPTNINTGTSTGAVNVGNSLAGAVGITSGAAFTLAGGAASTVSTTAGNINIQPAGTGTANVQIGTGGAGTTTPDYLALDVKSTTGDPAGGTEGYMYYNTFDNKFRCFENAAWKDCDTTGGATSLQTAYGNGATITTAGAVPVAFTLTNGGLNITGAGATAIGNNAGTVAVDSTTWDISTAGVASGFTGITSANGTISLNANSGVNTTSIGTGTTSGTVAIGGNADQVAVDSSTWDITGAGVASGLTGITSANGTISLNANSGVNTTSIGTGTTTGTVSIGGNADQVAVDSSTWDISGAGLASGLTGITSTGNIVFTGATSFRMPQAAADPGTCNVGQTYFDTATATVKYCRVANTWVPMGRGNANAFAMDSGTTAALAGGTVTTNFATTFSVAPKVVITPTTTSNFTNNTLWPYISAVSTTQFTITAAATYNADTFNWVAIGH